MVFNEHYKLQGKHAFLSASKSHWINYDEAKLFKSFDNAEAAKKGTELHDLAAQLIKHRQKLPRSNKTLNMYVNDCIGFRMKTEQTLYYSDNAFGTADAILFKNNLLRIFDYKSGVNPAKMIQLVCYVAFFCLEYGIDPYKIDIELRLYQNDEVIIDNPDREYIKEIMNKIIKFDKLIEKRKAERSAM